MTSDTFQTIAICLGLMVTIWNAGGLMWLGRNHLTHLAEEVRLLKVGLDEVRIAVAKISTRKR
jgi:hypothetical protein